MPNIDGRRKSKKGILSDSMIDLRLALGRAGIDLHEACRLLRLPYKTTYISFWRDAHRGKSGKQRLAVLRFLERRGRSFADRRLKELAERVRKENIERSSA